MSENWVQTISASIVADEGIGAANAGGVNLALYHVDGEYFATDNLCTHGQALLTDGYLDGHMIECPLHQGLFDIRSGAAAGAPCVVGVRSYPVRVEDGILHVQLG